MANRRRDRQQGGHHSGNWGGILANPGIILANAIASIIDARGRVLARDILPRSIPTSVRAALADCVVEGSVDGPAIDAWWGEPGLSVAEKGGEMSRLERFIRRLQAQRACLDGAEPGPRS